MLNMKYPISFLENPNAEMKTLVKGLNEEAKEKKGISPSKFFGFFIKDEKENIIGGITGYIYSNSLSINLLWVDKKLREKGYGSNLLQKAEEYAKENGCSFVTLETLNWQAPEFYKKNGYKEEFRQEGYAKNSTKLHFRKDF